MKPVARALSSSASNPGRVERMLAIKHTLEDEGVATELDGATVGTGIDWIIAQRDDEFSQGRVLDSQRIGGS